MISWAVTKIDYRYCSLNSVELRLFVFQDLFIFASKTV